MGLYFLRFLIITISYNSVYWRVGSFVHLAWALLGGCIQLVGLLGVGLIWAHLGLLDLPLWAWQMIGAFTLWFAFAPHGFSSSSNWWQNCSMRVKALFKIFNILIFFYYNLASAFNFIDNFDLWGGRPLLKRHMTNDFHILYFTFTIRLWWKYIQN